MRRQLKKEEIMATILKKYWFVALVAILLCGFAVYYVWDTTKDNIAGKSVAGKDVLASIDGYDLSADAAYEEMSYYKDFQLYYRFRSAVIDEAIETTDEIEENASKMEESFRTQYSEAQIETVLSYVGMQGDQLADYCRLIEKERVMLRSYVKEHYDTLRKDFEDKQPRVISLISLPVNDADSLSEEEQDKVDAIDQALKEGTSFADTAKEHSESGITDENGLYGYIDSDTASWLTTSNAAYLEKNILNAALKLKEGETSAWVKVESDNGDTMVLVHADIVGADHIQKQADDTIWYSLGSSLLQTHSTLNSEILFAYADQLDVTFADEETEARIRQRAGLDAETE